MKRKKKQQNESCKKKQEKLKFQFHFIPLHLKNQEEKFELIATSIKNAKAVTTTSLGKSCNYFSSLKFKTI